MKLKKENIDKYFDDWAIEAGEQIDKEGKKWDEFDYASAINFMLNDIKADVKKLVKNNAL